MKDNATIIQENSFNALEKVFKICVLTEKMQSFSNLHFEKSKKKNVSGAGFYCFKFSKK